MFKTRGVNIGGAEGAGPSRFIAWLSRWKFVYYSTLVFYQYRTGNLFFAYYMIYCVVCYNKKYFSAVLFKKQKD